MSLLGSLSGSDGADAAKHAARAQMEWLRKAIDRARVKA